MSVAYKEVAGQREWTQVLEHFGDFELLSLLAKGGMAELFMARHVPSNKLVVLKRLLPELKDRADVIEMFLTEADVGRLLVHDNIVRVLDAGEVNGRYYIVMEYVDGTDIEHVLAHAWRAGKPLPVDLIFRAGVDALRGLHAAHTLKSPQGTSFGLVHRDVSPDNFFITRTGVTKVADFGIAKLSHIEGVTTTGLLKGKLTYMSPEQTQGKALDGRADMFALALILYEMLTAERPFSQQEGESEIDTLMRVRKGKVPNVLSKEPKLDKGCAKAVDKALRRWRFFRFKDCEEFAEALEYAAACADLLATREELGVFVSAFLAETQVR
ncbi:MAG: serine/threonine protein kinase [Deltaproteobacteria bacterium]|nr:serine/threonine protein kinase [Deltaproteobacteria bacterium]